MLRLHILFCPFPDDFTNYKCSKCVHIYTPPPFNEATMTVPIHLGRPDFCLRVGTLVDVHVSQNQLCVVLKYVRVQKKKLKEKNVKCRKKKEKTLKELSGFSQ
uniref:Uncharacterized protein n=1 Tax=Rhipicephalus zambeziensis TaxID=60191 RepID=A0A224YJP9_9ACAR